MTKSDVVDQAVRDYLLYLDDPANLVDHEKVAALERKVAAATDPLERLVMLAEFERARIPIEAEYRARFVEHAKAWADANRVPAAAFRALGVPTDVLVDAGLVDKRSSARRRTGTSRSVPVEQIQAAARRLRGPFRATEVVEAAGGGSPMTVRKALNGLVDTGEIRRLGPDPDWSSRGRAPILYEQVK